MCYKDKSFLRLLIGCQGLFLLESLHVKDWF